MKLYLWQMSKKEKKLLEFFARHENVITQPQYNKGKKYPTTGAGMWKYDNFPQRNSIP
jgi:hypothetical protein